MIFELAETWREGLTMVTMGILLMAFGVYLDYKKKLEANKK